MGVELGSELAPRANDVQDLRLTLQTDSAATVALLREVRVVLAQLPAAIEAAVQRALTAQNLARTTQVHVDAPDLSELNDIIARLPQAATAQDIREAVTGAVTMPPPRKVRRTVNRDAWGRIESVTEEEQ